MLPIGAAMKMWFRCAFASTRMLDVSDWHALHTEAGLHDVLFDFPENLAGDADASSEGSLSIEMYAKRPPAKASEPWSSGGVLSVRCWLEPCETRSAHAARRLDPQTRSIPFSEKDFVAAILVCSLRRRPKVRCYLCPLAAADFPAWLSVALRGRCCFPGESGEHDGFQWVLVRQTP